VDETIEVVLSASKKRHPSASAKDSKSNSVANAKQGGSQPPKKLTAVAGASVNLGNNANRVSEPAAVLIPIKENNKDLLTVPKVKK
jgi:hypothetical protein